MSSTLIINLHLASTCMMTGLIWLVQLVHYPAFAQIEKSLFVDFHRYHTTRITWIVMPLMLIELTTGLALIRIYQHDTILLANAVVLLLIWASTFLLSIPYHRKLSAGWNEQYIKRLVITNWPRTLLWSGRSLALIYLITTNQIT